MYEITSILQEFRLSEPCSRGVSPDHISGWFLLRREPGRRVVRRDSCKGNKAHIICSWPPRVDVVLEIAPAAGSSRWDRPPSSPCTRPGTRERAPRPTAWRPKRRGPGPSCQLPRPSRRHQSLRSGPHRSRRPFRIARRQLQWSRRDRSLEQRRASPPRQLRWPRFRRRGPCHRRLR